MGLKCWIELRATSLFVSVIQPLFIFHVYCREKWKIWTDQFPTSVVQTTTHYSERDLQSFQPTIPSKYLNWGIPLCSQCFFFLLVFNFLNLWRISSSILQGKLIFLHHDTKFRAAYKVDSYGFQINQFSATSRTNLLGLLFQNVSDLWFRVADSHSSHVQANIFQKFKT